MIAEFCEGAMPVYLTNLKGDVLETTVAELFQAHFPRRILHMQQNNNTFKSGFISIIGRPNVGKSTFLNHVVGQKIAIMSDKPQTTRNKVQGVVTTDDSQLIFIDTPGIHKPKHKLGDFMVKVARNTLRKSTSLCLWSMRTNQLVAEIDLLSKCLKIRKHLYF